MTDMAVFIVYSVTVFVSCKAYLSN